MASAPLRHNFTGTTTREPQPSSACYTGGASRGWRLQRTLLEEGGRYRYVRDVGSGGMARIIEVEHTELGSRHAMKILKVLSPELRQRLLAEGRLQAKLSHPNIVNVTDVVRLDGGFPALVLELVDGPSLDALRGRFHLTIPEVDVIGRGLLRGLIAAHRVDCIHRDLKPGNVLLELSRSRARPKIADFGLAKSFEAQGEARTMTGMSMGTPRYMAPEQYTNAKTVDRRADLFSMATILYELLTGRSCFPKADFLTIYGRAREGVYAPIRELAPDAPARMVRAIEDALSPEPDQRPTHAAAMLGLWEDGTAAPTDVWTPERLDELRSIARAFTSEQVAEQRPTEVFGAGGPSGDEAVTVLDLPSSEGAAGRLADVPGRLPVDPLTSEPPPSPNDILARPLDQVAEPLLLRTQPAEDVSLVERALWGVVVAGAFGFSVLLGLLIARLALGSM